MNCAICWNHLGYTDTSFISLNLILAMLVKDPFNRKWNQQVTKGRKYTSHLVGTSETTRAISYGKPGRAILFNQWLAGLIDGTGCFLISRKGNTTCEITVPIVNVTMLYFLQEKLGGKIKIRSGEQTVRWRLQNKKGILDLLTRVNGHIRQTSRLIQLNRISSVLGLQILSPDSLHSEHAWFAGFFDAVGSIEISSNSTSNIPQLIISINNKLYADVVHFRNCFGGNIYYDKGLNGYYK